MTVIGPFTRRICREAFGDKIYLRFTGRAISALLALLLTWGSTAAAQNANAPFSASSSVTASVEVIHLELEMLTIRNVRLDKVQPSEGVIYVNPITNSGAGLMKAEGSPEAPIRITFQRQMNLVHETGASSLTFFYEIAGNTRENQSSAELITNSSRGFELNEDGEFFIWIGGRVDITTAISGNYEGEFTVEVEYI